MATWMLAHAHLIAANNHGELWQLDNGRAVVQFVEKLSCQQLEKRQQQYFCRRGTDEFWHIQNLNGSYYAQSFRHNQQPLKLRKTWLGKQVLAQNFEQYVLEIFASEHKAKTLANGFTFRFGARLVSVKEIEHGRFHILLDNPETSVLLVQQANVTHSIQITTRAKSG